MMEPKVEPAEAPPSRSVESVCLHRCPDLYLGVILSQISLFLFGVSDKTSGYFKSYFSHSYSFRLDFGGHIAFSLSLSLLYLADMRLLDYPTSLSLYHRSPLGL